MSLMGSTDKHKNIKLRAEDELLLCCAHTNVNRKIGDKILYLIENNLDWNYLLKLASRHGLTPLLYHNINSICPELVPENILKELKDKFNANVRKNLMLTGELIKVLNLLESGGITAVPYKGPVLASIAYGNIALRQFGDLDIFIAKSDVLKAKNILTSNSYNPLFNLDDSDNIYLKYHRDYVFINEFNNVIIELHWKFSSLSISFSKEFKETFHEVTEIIDLNNLRTLNIVNESLILILCTHNAQHYWNRLNWICDISELIQSTNNINWHRLINEANKLGIKRIVLINLSLIHFLLDLKLHEDIHNEITTDKTVKIITRKIIQKIFFEEDYMTLIEKIALRVKIYDNNYNKIKELTNLFLIPTPLELEKISLPLPLFPFYYLLRIIRLLRFK